MSKDFFNKAAKNLHKAVKNTTFEEWAQDIQNRLSKQFAIPPQDITYTEYKVKGFNTKQQFAARWFIKGIEFRVTRNSKGTPRKDPFQLQLPDSADSSLKGLVNKKSTTSPAGLQKILERELKFK